MILELFLLSTFVLICVANLIIYKNKHNLVKFIIGFFVALLYLPFKLYSGLNEFMYIYQIILVLFIFIYSLIFVPKKVTKNITEYDFFELEKSYNDLKDDREKLRQRYLSTVSLIEEGIVFYENGCNDVILSDNAKEIFGGKQALSLEEHAQSISAIDRSEYLRTIDKISKKQLTYEVKYRITRGEHTNWVLEKGHYIGVDTKKSIIATVMPLDVKCFIHTSYFDVDSMYQEEKVYPILKNMIDNRKPFSFIFMELSNISEINTKYGREMGSLMMNDYIKMIKNNYQKDINKMFRVTGIRYALIIDDYRVYDEFHRDLLNNQSEIYTTKIQIAGIKDVVVPNFGVVNLSGAKNVDSMELVKIAEKMLDEAINSSRRNYSIFGE